MAWLGYVNIKWDLKLMILRRVSPVQLNYHLFTLETISLLPTALIVSNPSSASQAMYERSAERFSR